MPKQSKELFLRGEVWWYRFTHPQTHEQIRRSSGSKEKKAAQLILDRAKADAWHEYQLELAVNAEHRIFSEAAIRLSEEKLGDKSSLINDMQYLRVIEAAITAMSLPELTNECIYEKIVKTVLAERDSNLKPTNIKHHLALIHFLRYLSLTHAVLDES